MCVHFGEFLDLLVFHVNDGSQALQLLLQVFVLVLKLLDFNLKIRREVQLEAYKSFLLFLLYFFFWLFCIHSNSY